MSGYIWAFIIGGLICVIGQLLIDLANLTPAQVLVSFVVIGTILGALGLYQKLALLGGAGATVPIPGFGLSLAKGVMKAVREYGFLGAFTGGAAGTAGGITAAVVFGYIMALIFNPKTK